MNGSARFGNSLLAGILVTLLYGAFPSSSISSDIYRWQDERGVTHYSSSPPEQRNSVKLIPRPMPTPEMQEAAERRAQRDIEDSKRALPERREKEAADVARDEQRADERARLVARCGLARQQLGVLIRGGPVYTRDKHGNRVYLDDSERDRETSRARLEVEQACRGIAVGNEVDAAEKVDRQLVAAERCLELRRALSSAKRSGSRIGSSDIRELREAMQRACGTTL
ncbi:MAG: DUF4124 domain-containing protein [Rhodocyclaceae bacterium]|nr:DUF4124 domain-containing protein [Rhodocyclaceae bacterium]